MLCIQVTCYRCKKLCLFPLEQFKEYKTPDGCACFNCKAPFFEFDDIPEEEIAKYTTEYDEVEKLV